MNYVIHFLRAITYLALNAVVGQDDDKNDGEVLLRKLIYEGTNAIKYEHMYTFTAPIRLCEKPPCGAQDDLKLVFPLFIGLDGRGSFSNGPYKPEATPDGSGIGGDKGSSYLDGGLTKTTPMYLLFNNTCDDTNKNNNKGNGGGNGCGDNNNDPFGGTKSTKTVTLGGGGGGQSKSTKTFILGDKSKNKLREGFEINKDPISYDNVGNNVDYERNFGRIRSMNHHTSNYYKFRPVKDFK